MGVIVKFFKRFMPYIKGHWRYFIIAILGAIMTAGSTALVAYFVNPLLGALSGKIPEIPLISFEDMQDNNYLAIVMALIIVFLYIIKASGMYIQGYFMSYIGGDIIRQVQNRMLKHLLSFELSYFNKMRGGELMSRTINDIGIIRTAVSSYVAEFVRESVTIIGLVAVVIFQNPQLAFFGLVVLPMAIIPLNIIFRRIKKYIHSSMQKGADINAKLAEIFNNIEIIKASNGERLESEIFESKNLELFNINMKSTKYSQLTTPMMEILGAIALGVVLYIAIVQISKNNITLEEFGSFATALFMLWTPIKRLVNMWGGMAGAIAANDRISQILERKPQINDGNITLKAPLECISLKNASFAYGENIAAINNISLDFKRNEITAIIGESGAGKSTLVNLLLRLYECSSGEITINGVNIKDYTQHSLSQNIAIVPQRIFIFNDTIAKNVAYGLELDENRVESALKDAQLLDFVKSLPSGIHTILDEFGVNLSGGQRQRIAIARALYKQPEMLILDEVTSALDSNTENLIKDAIDNIRSDKIIVIIAHRPSTIELADKIVRLDSGAIKEIVFKKQKAESKILKDSTKAKSPKKRKAESLIAESPKAKDSKPKDSNAKDKNGKKY